MVDRFHDLSVSVGKYYKMHRRSRSIDLLYQKQRRFIWILRNWQYLFTVFLWAQGLFVANITSNFENIFWNLLISNCKCPSPWFFFRFPASMCSNGRNTIRNALNDSCLAILPPNSELRCCHLFIVVFPHFKMCKISVMSVSAPNSTTEKHFLWSFYKVYCWILADLEVG